MWANSNTNRVSPVSDNHGAGQISMTEVVSSDWGDQDNTTSGDKNNAKQRNTTQTNKVGVTRKAYGRNDDEEKVRRRRKRSFEPGSDEYASYVEKRVFNKRQAWTPFLWQRKRDKQLLGNLNPTRGWKGWKHRQKMRWNSVKLTYSETMASLEVWRKSLKRIEGHQGTAAVSYFVFLRFLFFLNIFIFLATFICVVFFQVVFDETAYSKETTGYDISDNHPGVSLANNCTPLYVVNESSGFQLFLDFVQGTGWMESTSFFYGYYTNTEVVIPGNMYNIPLAYIVTTLVVLLASLIVMVHHTFSNYTDTLLSGDINSDSNNSFRITFCNWDFRVCEELPITLQQQHFYQMICAELEEQRHEERKRNSTSAQRCCLWFIRIVINLVIIILLGASAAAIYYAQTFSSSFTTSDNKKDYHMMVILFVEYLPSIIIAALNAGYPILFALVVKLEQYKPSIVLKITILRIVFVRLAALIVVTLTIYQDISCAKHDECYVGIDDCPAIKCWENYVGQQIYKFMVTEFAVELLVTLGYELPRKLLTTKCDCGLLNKLGPAEFDIAILVLDLVYGQALCWLGFFFCPLIPVMMVLRLFILFYLKKLSALYTTVPPERPYHASRSNAFFMITLLLTFFLVAVPVGYVLVQVRPSPMCGPFRIYDYPTEIVSIQIDVASQGFRTFWLIVTSSAFITTFVVILGLALYYCSAMRSANNRLIRTMKAQLLQDDKDKQYLLLQLSKYTGGDSTDKPTPNKHNPPRDPPKYVSPRTEMLNQHNAQPKTDYVQPKTDYVQPKPDYGQPKMDYGQSGTDRQDVPTYQTNNSNQKNTTSIGGDTVQATMDSDW